ncbi:S9 family peptidase [Ponticaulis sp.]|uniref:S9 family peptidase n=1 Tax=Ponticaulis sp. TaxID=2020902 RepID=UPI000B72598B|nr:S9 family peptidase [Ponticaulis sp.]MAI89199.1 S9 family peptidase [Ponticaulis sp.]OUY01193.1 MAG: S9 family peptidase [Hyphomonadaceae bacterium TMED5]|tara:strand:- start:66637 stop:68937 length:2301 start_codon:yes stop_codon:yes gene_type:complete
MSESPRLTIERLFQSPSLSGPSAQGVKFSPDGRRVTFLKSRENDGARYDLWQFDVATGEQSMLVDSLLLEPEEVELSEEEIALRERRRIAGRRGIVSYDWGTSDTILVPLGGDLHLITLTENGPVARQLTDTEAFEYDAKVSPLGNYVSFIRDGVVIVIDLATGEEKQITPDADPDNAISYGVAEFVAQEEMRRYTGYWWSPDESYIAYTRVDESTVPIMPRFDIGADGATIIEQRYPRAGDPNAIVDLFVYGITDGRTDEARWRNDEWCEATDQYLARVNWAGTTLVVQAVNREQTIIRFTQHWPETLFARESFYEETQENWVNLSNDFVTLSTSPGSIHRQGDIEILTTSEANGYRMPVFVARNTVVPLLDTATGVVTEILYVDIETSTVYFEGNLDTPLETHLYRAHLPALNPQDGQSRLPDSVCVDTTPDAAQSTPLCPTVERVTEGGRSWSITMSPDGESFVGTSSSPTQPPQTGLYGADGSLITWIEENRLDENHPYYPFLENHTVPQYGTLTAEDGQTLYYSIQMPPDFDPTNTYPVLVEIYGGPHVQRVDRNWERLSDQFYTHQGYIVFRLDNRGSYNRGKRFEDAIFQQMGIPEVRDQLVGVEWLRAQPFVDKNRIAIEGWSYGGYMTLMAILQAPEGTFAAAASGAPVTDWAMYDTFYTERYMRTPQTNAEGYEASSVFSYTDNLTTPLLLMHGMADDNVPFENTTRLMAEFQQKGLVFDLMTYPGQRHGIRGAALQTHLLRTRMEFLNRHLNPGE